MGPNLGTSYDTAEVFLNGQNLHFRKRGTEEDSQYLKSHGAGSISPMTLGQRGSSTPSGILYYDTGGYGRSMARQSISGVYQGDKYSATSILFRKPKYSIFGFILIWLKIFCFSLSFSNGPAK